MVLPQAPDRGLYRICTLQHRRITHELLPGGNGVCTGVRPPSALALGFYIRRGQGLKPVLARLPARHAPHRGLGHGSVEQVPFRMCSPSGRQYGPFKNGCWPAGPSRSPQVFGVKSSNSYFSGLLRHQRAATASRREPCFGALGVCGALAVDSRPLGRMQIAARPRLHVFERSGRISGPHRLPGLAARPDVPTSRGLFRRAPPGDFTYYRLE